MREVIVNLIEWNKDIHSADEYNLSPRGMQLLAANCMLITSIGEGINRIEREDPEFLASNYPQIPWRMIVGMRNNLAHGYFEVDEGVVYNVVKVHVPPLLEIMDSAISLIKGTPYEGGTAED